MSRLLYRLIVALARFAVRSGRSKDLEIIVLRHDQVDQFGKLTLRRGGRLHHIRIGRTHTGTPVVLIIEDLNIKIIATQTGEIIRTLTLNPNHDYQPQNKQNP